MRALILSGCALLDDSDVSRLEQHCVIFGEM